MVAKLDSDGDPDFTEYRYRTPTPEAPSQKNAPMSKKPSGPGPSNSAKSGTKSTVKSEPSSSGSLVSTVSTVDAGSLSSLPQFVRMNWISRFLPTLYHRFGSSEEPWKEFSKGEGMLLIIQEVVNEVYPGNTYQARWGDKICTAVLNFLFSFCNPFNSFLISR